MLALPGQARADLVRMNNGRVISVEAVRFEGESVILEFRGGGEVKAPKDVVSEILPDEVPYAKAFALEALAASKAATGPRLSDVAVRELVDRVAARVGLNQRLARAVVQIESNWDSRAVSSKGAMGLMQIMPAVAQDYAVDDPFDPEKNLEAGMRYLRNLLEHYGYDSMRALAAYNAGPGAVSKYGGVPPYQETRDYVQKVLALVRKP
ncbi:MAG TPA: lytic transglycosylase domain-containing protein [Vicinamibacterales bacterium]|nr:lytic transglycosylase domain-containing protein [Vicinamibacterales bacterium]